MLKIYLEGAGEQGHKGAVSMETVQKEANAAKPAHLGKTISSLSEIALVTGVQDSM